jgi:uncharacterized cysteine cluster protein YcgN (CxxCxxCC family)
MKASNWWQKKSLQDMSTEEWESLCDGCARCCLIKLQDEETDELYTTNVACQYLDLEQCRCTEYENRRTLVPTCVSLTVENIETELYYMPDSCAYKLLWQGKDLPVWHPLQGGDTRQSGMSISAFAILETEVDEDELEDHIID